MNIEKILSEAHSLVTKNDDGKVDLENIIIKSYEIYVKKIMPDSIVSWPVISGANRIVGTYKDYVICIFKHTGNNSFFTKEGVGKISLNLVGENNIDIIRKELQQHFNLSAHDSIFIIHKEYPTTDFQREINVNFMKHKIIMKKEPMKIFLSHKGTNKNIVRKYNNILKTLGFSPWLDEEAMVAGSNLNRAILNGIEDSCATVFFITDAYVDETYLSDEVDYSIDRIKNNPNFKIITLVFGDNTDKIPSLLKKYVWKHIDNDLDGLHEILKALPIEVGGVSFKY